MKRINFLKLNATGNDFIVIDNREKIISADDELLWSKLCRLKTGIGADGVLLVEKSLKADFKMRYINADGGEVSMCGNGGRAITAFVHQELKFNKGNYFFETMNSVYECQPDSDFGYSLKMTELYDVEKFQINDLLNSKQAKYLNTGVPHCVFEVEDLEHFEVYKEGKRIRTDKRFPQGTNVNFFEMTGPEKLKIRTYERGVENETLSCGTGSVATAIVASKKYGILNQVVLETPGGVLAVRFNKDYSEIYLCGKVEKVFEGSFQIN